MMGTQTVDGRLMPMPARIAMAVGAWFVASVVTLFFTGPNVFLAGWFFSIGSALLGFGGMVYRQGADETVRVRYWGTPVWLGVIATVVMGIGSIITLTPREGLLSNDLDFYSVVIALIFPIVGIVATIGVRRFFSTKRKERLDAGTPEAKLGVMQDRMRLGRAGLSVKSEHTAEHLVPRIVGAGFIGKLRNPYIDVAIIGGRQTVEDYQKGRERLASAWGVGRVEAQLIDSTNQIVRLTAIVTEFKREGTVSFTPHPALVRGEVPDVASYLKDGLVVGELDESDEPWTVAPGKFYTSLSSGLMGSGKTSVINVREAHYVAHPHIDVFHLDLKDGQAIRAWLKGVSAFAPGPNSGVELLTFIMGQMLGERSVEMRKAGVSNAWEGRKEVIRNADGTVVYGEDGKPKTRHIPFLGPDHHTRVVIVDEVQELFEEGADPRIADMAIRALQALVRKSRSYGYILELATQRPTADALPTMVRDNTNNREAFRVNPGTTRFALTDAWIEAKEGNPNVPDPSKIATEEVGRAVTVIKGKYRYVQAAFLDDSEIEAIAEANSHHVTRFYDWQKQAQNLDINALIAELDSNAMDDLMEQAGWVSEQEPSERVDSEVMRPKPIQTPPKPVEAPSKPPTPPTPAPSATPEPEPVEEWKPEPKDPWTV